MAREPERTSSSSRSSGGRASLEVLSRKSYKPPSSRSEATCSLPGDPGWRSAEAVVGRRDWRRRLRIERPGRGREERGAKDGPSASRSHPSCAARGAQSSQTVRRCPPPRKMSGCSPRNNRRPHTSHSTSGWKVTIVRVAMPSRVVGRGLLRVAASQKLRPACESADAERPWCEAVRCATR
jgi:hypothetical protein